MASLYLTLLKFAALAAIILLSSAQDEVRDAAEDGPRLVWTELHSPAQRARISSLPADPSYANDGMVETRFYYQSENSQFVGIDADYANRTAFWTASMNRTIFRGGLGVGVSGESMFKGTSKSVEGIAVDWLAKNVYWTDANYDWIMISDYNATYFTVLIDTGLEKPRGIATYPQKGYLFWTDWGDNKLIERSTLAGKNRTVLINNTDLYYPNGIAVDYETERVYWVDAAQDGGRIESINIDGSNRSLLIEMQPRVAHFFDLAIYGNYIFVTDLSRQLRCIQKDTAQIAFALNLGARPFGIMTYGAGLQPLSSSPCDSNPCEHLCTGAPGQTGYQCVCSHGYQLAENGTSCLIDESRITKPQLLVVTRNEITRYPANFADLTSEAALAGKMLVDNKVLLVALDIDSQGEMLYFSDYGKKEINRVRLESGAAIKVVVGGVGSVEGVAVDWLNQNLYWSDAQRNHIAVARYDGSRRKFLFEDNVIRPRSLVIHATRKMIFWTEFGAPAQIERGNLDGTGRLVIKTGLSSPNGLAIDFKQDRLYYASRGNGLIESMTLDGRQASRVYLKSRAKYFDIDIYKDYLYFTEWGSDNGVHAININTNQLVKSVSLPKTAYGVRMYDDSRQPTGQSDCDEDTCDHLCLPRTPEGFVCHCSIGYTLDADNVTCNVDLLEDNFVLVTDTHIPALFQISLENGMKRFTAIPLEGLVRPIAVAFDPIDSRVYWTDVRLGSFSRAFLNGTGQETLGRAGVEGPDGMTVDQISRLLYWTDVGRNTVTVSSLDGTQIKTLIDSGLDQPRAIVLDPVGGYMYFSDWGTVPKIEKAHMDGTNRVVLVDTQIAWPNGLALDVEGGKLYWADAKEDRIERINFDGGNREVLVDLSPSGHPYGIALYGPHIYWSDWKKFGLMRALKADGSGIEFVGPQTLTRLNEILIYNSSLELAGSNACSRENGGCSHLCMPTPVGRTCACPDGILLDNETSTICLTSNLTCPTGVAFGRFLTEDCSYEPGRRCTVECDPGYWSVSESYDVLCMASGQWEDDMSSFCTVVECPELNITANATVVECPEPPLQNSTCVQECQVGYKRTSGATTLTCQEDGTWSDSPLACAAVTCPPLENPPNGLYRPSNCTTSGGRFDSRCILYCQNGYLHQGVSARSCQMDGHWTDEEIISACIDGVPPSFGDTCPPDQTLTADLGQTFALLNISSPTATDESGGIITYEASEDAPYVLEEGENAVSIVARDEANNTVVCNFNVNVTVSYCDYLSFPLNGFIEENCTFHYGSVCRYACSDGYRLIGQSDRTCDYNEGGDLTWLGDKAVCEAVICPEPVTDPTKMHVSGCEAPYRPSVECLFVCAEGYHQVNGTSVRTCQDNGTWSGEEFYCHVRVCGPLEPFERGVIQPETCMSGGTVSNVCTLSCQEGFRYQGKAEHVCLATGEWSNRRDFPTCEDATAPHFNNTCPQDFTVDALPGMTAANVTWDIPQAVDFHSEIWNLTSSHQPGTMMLEGLNAVIVTATDTFGNNATCRFYVTVRVIRCGEYPLPNHAFWQTQCSGLLGTNCTLGCRRGYNLSGAERIKCVMQGETGNWESVGNDPVCQPVMCPPVSRFGGMMLISCPQRRPLPFGTTCNVMCDPRRTLTRLYMIGPSMLIRLSCQPDGTWVNIFGSRDVVDTTRDMCQVNCPAFPVPENGVLLHGSSDCTSGRSASTGATCVVQCQAGFSLPQNQRVPAYRCLTNGRWAPRVPQEIFCQDTTRPVFKGSCPVNYTFTAPQCSMQANVSYPVPSASDTSGGRVYIKAPGGMLMPMLLPRGTHERIYQAVDQAGNVQSCQVNIQVNVRGCSIPRQSLSSLRIESSTCQYLYGSTVRFVCMKGMNMVGAPELTCLGNGSWSGAIPTCERVSCTGLTPPANVILPPPVCNMFNPLSFVHSILCRVKCADGYRISPSNLTIVPTCLLNGTWTGIDQIGDVECIDISRPTFTFCPAGFSVTLDEGASTATVSWERPTAQDNSESVEVTGPDNSAMLSPGAEIFTYVATDAVGLTTRCSFEVTVIDLEPPTALNCQEELTVVQSDTLPVRVIFDPPLFTDNVGIAHERHVQWYTRYRWKDNLSYEWGHVVMHYSALDRAGNEATCDLKFQIVQSTECPALAAPPNSELTCNDASTDCSLQCNQGYYFQRTGDRSPLDYTCQSSGLWNHSTIRNDNPYLPVCTQRETADSNRWVQTSNFVFNMAGNCSTNTNAIKTKLQALFRTSNLFKSCLNDAETDCSLSEPAVSCDQSGDRDGPRRRRRQTPSEVYTNDVTLSLTMTATKGGLVIPSFISNFDSDVGNLWSQNNVTIAVGNATAVLDQDQSSLSGFTAVCPEGQLVSNHICVRCPPGTYHDTRSSSCTPCPMRQFQDQPGQTRCKACPTGKATRAVGAYSLDQCQAMCSPGTYSYTGIGPECLVCPVGSYQESQGLRGCRPCPANTTTSGPGSTSADSCIDPSDVTSPRPTTTEADNVEITPNPVTESNNQDENSTPAIINIQPTPAIVITAEPTPVTMTTDKSGYAPPTAGRKTGEKSRVNPGLAVGASFGILIVFIVLIVGLVLWRRRHRTIPMTKFTNITITSSEGFDDEHFVDEDHDDHGATSLGKYQQMQEMDNFDLEHLTAYHESPAAEKRNSFSNALYQSEELEPKQEFPSKVWTTFDDNAESRT